MWLALPLALITGILSRISDMYADDGLKLNRFLGYSLGILYGLIISYTITQFPELAPLGIAIILSVIFTGKIDHPVHYLGIASMALFLFVFGIPQVNTSFISITSLPIILP